MKTLVGWDNDQEAELLSLYLTIGNNEMRICTQPIDLLAQAGAETWDVVLLAQTFHTLDESFTVFTQLQQLLPEVPVVLACRLSEMIGLPRFLTHGLRSYVIRDERGDFVFLILANLESTVDAVRSERSRRLAHGLRNEMFGVRMVQQSIIPRALPALGGFRIAMRHEPAELPSESDQANIAAGGDYYNVFTIDEGTVLTLLGDTSAHGLKASLSIVALDTLIRRMSAGDARDPAGLVTAINKRVCDHSLVQSGGGFVTLCAATIDAGSNTLVWASAGHPSVLLHQMSSREVTILSGSDDAGLPLGIVADFTYAARSMTIPAASRVLLYSDGLTDIRAGKASARASFGTDGLIEVLRSCRLMSAEETLEELFRASREFGNGRRPDDVSAVLIERLAN